jgi:hypothetical protein
MTTPPLAHFYHVYADGNWAPMVHEHCGALRRYGLYDALDVWAVGFVGTPDNIAAARATLDGLAPGYEVVATSSEGWEQETLNPLWKWCRRRRAKGPRAALVGYGHTKGASRNDPIDQPWRRAMTYHNFVNWQRPVEALQNGTSIAGCYWHTGGPSSREGYGVGGMFGGNFWWTRADLLRQSPAPGMISRHYAEHWLGQLCEVTPLIPGETILDLSPACDIGAGAPEWAA